MSGRKSTARATQKEDRAKDMSDGSLQLSPVSYRLLCVGISSRTQFIQKYNLNHQKQDLPCAVLLFVVSRTRQQVRMEHLQAPAAQASEADTSSKGGGSVLV